MDLKDIVLISKRLKAQMEKNLPFIISEIDSIIINKDKSVKRIETLLDILLDYSQMDFGKKEFNRLNSYYASFNKENAEAYKQFYKEFD